jgi:hypothetical protein
MGRQESLQTDLQTNHASPNNKVDRKPGSSRCTDNRTVGSKSHPLRQQLIIAGDCEELLHLADRQRAPLSDKVNVRFGSKADVIFMERQVR